MRLHVILPTMAIFGLIVTPQLGEAREIDEKKLIFSQLEDDDQLAVGRVHRDLPRADEPRRAVHHLGLAFEHLMILKLFRSRGRYPLTS